MQDIPCDTFDEATQQLAKLFMMLATIGTPGASRAIQALMNLEEGKSASFALGDSIRGRFTVTLRPTGR